MSGLVDDGFRKFLSLQILNPSGRLYQIMTFKWFVDIHGVQSRGIKARELHIETMTNSSEFSGV